MWDNVDLNGQAPHIRVRHALRFEHNRPVVSEKLKSPAARRDIPIPPKLVECLMKLHETNTSEYVIADRNGLPLTGSQFRHLWNAIVVRTAGERKYWQWRNGVKEVRVINPQLGETAQKRKYKYTIGFEVTPHILRHTYITELLLAGVDVKTVQYLAGHEKAKSPLIFTHT